jgi:hypothetical protein
MPPGATSSGGRAPGALAARRLDALRAGTAVLSFAFGDLGGSIESAQFFARVAACGTSGCALGLGSAVLLLDASFRPRGRARRPSARRRRTRFDTRPEAPPTPASDRALAPRP